MNTIVSKAGEPISIDVDGDPLTWLHEDVRTKQGCVDVIDTKTHPVTRWEPLDIEGTLTCSQCGLQGSIHSGKWLRVFKRKPGQTVAEGYAAWRRYSKRAAERIRKEEEEGKR